MGVLKDIEKDDLLLVKLKKSDQTQIEIEGWTVIAFFMFYDLVFIFQATLTKFIFSPPPIGVNIG